MGIVAFITVPLLITTVVAVHFIRRRNRERLLHSPEGRQVEELDTTVVGATIVLTSLSPDLRERTLELLPPQLARAIVMIMPELPPVANETIEKEKRRWLSHFNPPRRDLQGIESEEPRNLAAATVRLILEDSA